MRQAMAAMAVLVALIFVAPAPVRAAGGTYYIGSTDGAATVTTGCATDGNATCTLQGALAQNAADGGGGTVRFGTAFPAGAQTITVGGTLALTGATAGVTLDGTGKQVTISGGGVRVLSVGSGVAATLVALGITNGNAGAGDGGGILNSGDLTLVSVAVRGNSGTNGGGICNDGGTLTLVGSTVSDNGTTNPAGTGGGISNRSGTVVVVSSTVSGNYGGARGGGVFNGGTMTVADGTVSDNAAVVNSGGSGALGGGIFNGGVLHLASSVVAGNRASLTAESNVANDAGATFVPTGANVTSGDPLLGLLGDYGGPTQTRPPLPGSPALDTYDAVGGSCGSYTPAVGGQAVPITTDQRGVARPQGRCDSGAVEMRGFTIVATGGTPQAAYVGTRFRTDLEATLSETGGSPLPGAAVTVAVAPAATGASATLAGPTPLVTGAGGKVTIMATANSAAGGPYTATATTGNVSATFQLTNYDFVTIAPATLPAFKQGVAYSVKLTASGGTGTGFTFNGAQTMGGQLPPGVTLGADGTLAGTPTRPGTYRFVALVSDSTMNGGARSYTVTVAPGTPAPAPVARPETTSGAGAALPAPTARDGGSVGGVPPNAAPPRR